MTYWLLTPSVSFYTCYIRYFERIFIINVHMILDTIWMFKDHLWPTKQKCQKFINHGYLHSCCIIANVSENLGMCWYIIGTRHKEIGWTHILRECLNSRTYTRDTHFLTNKSVTSMSNTKIQDVHDFNFIEWLAK